MTKKLLFNCWQGQDIYLLQNIYPDTRAHADSYSVGYREDLPQRLM